jgi:hypothetical protein
LTAGHGEIPDEILSILEDNRVNAKCGTAVFKDYRRGNQTARVMPETFAEARLSSSVSLVETILPFVRRSLTTGLATIPLTSNTHHHAQTEDSHMLWKKGRRGDHVVDAHGEDIGGDFAQGQVSQCDTFATKSL